MVLNDNLPKLTFSLSFPLDGTFDHAPLLVDSVCSHDLPKFTETPTDYDLISSFA